MATTVNPLKRFKEVLGSSSKQICTVLAALPDGTSLVETRTGVQFIARGTGVVVEQRAWVVDGVVVSEAPALSVYSVSV